MDLVLYAAMDACAHECDQPEWGSMGGWAMITEQSQGRPAVPNHMIHVEESPLHSTIKDDRSCKAAQGHLMRTLLLEPFQQQQDRSTWVGNGVVTMSFGLHASDAGVGVSFSCSKQLER
jgi:hypothetical protein